MQCLHEFHKVELVRLCLPETVEQEFEELLAYAEHTLQQLQLTFRVVDPATGDLTFSCSRIFDLEVYSPGVDRWLEMSTISPTSKPTAATSGSVPSVEHGRCAR